MAQRKNSGRIRAPVDNRGTSATKRGPGRKHEGSKPGTRLTKFHKVRAADALTAAWAQKRITNWNGPRDEHGAYTLTGRSGQCHADGTEVRRKWLAGISAQRGY